VLTVKRKGAESFMHEISNKLFLKDWLGSKIYYDNHNKAIICHAYVTWKYVLSSQSNIKSLMEVKLPKENNKKYIISNIFCRLSFFAKFDCL
jgi:hypothetical protein